ncbi:MAG: ankyrin repeat domain-containing protein [Elusimicrobiaceae bacterium]|nr:ankyrin repeat domain-containing protein [Elusimicrobiaceae bacterium]
MKYIYSVLVFSVILCLTACDINFNWPNNCKNTCPPGQELKSDCTCYVTKKLPATEPQQKEILQALAQGNEQSFTNLILNIDPNSTFNLDLMQDLTPLKKVYANNTDISSRLDYQRDNLTLISLLAPLKNFNPAFNILLNNGADPNLESFPGLSPIEIAISADQEEKLKMLLKAGAKVNFEGEDNILIRTLNLRKYKALSILSDFAKESQISFRFPSNYFTMAMLENDTDFANAVLPLTDGVANIPNGFGVLPIVQAAVSNNFELMDNLIANGANIELKDQNLRTPILAYLQEIYIAKIEENLPKGKEKQITETVKHFLDKGADISVKDKEGENIVFYAIRGNNKPLIELLTINYRQDLNTKNNQGETPLFIAAQNTPELVPYLLSKGANPKVMDRNGRTPAVAAAEIGNMDIYDLLENAAARRL